MKYWRREEDQTRLNRNYFSEEKIFCKFKGLKIIIPLHFTLSLHVFLSLSLPLLRVSYFYDYQ